MEVGGNQVSCVSGYQLEVVCGLGMGAGVHFPSQQWDPIWLRPGVGLVHADYAYFYIMFLNVLSKCLSMHHMNVASSEARSGYHIPWS